MFNKAIIKNYLRQPFAWYDNVNMRSSRLPGGERSYYKLIVHPQQWLPFQIKANGVVNTIADLVIRRDCTFEEVVHLQGNAAATFFQFWVSADQLTTWIILKPNVNIFNLQCGRYYAEMGFVNSLGQSKIWHSEIFYVPDSTDMSRYLKFEWRHRGDILGILYQKGYFNRWYTEANLSRSESEIEEEGKNDGTGMFHPTFQRYIENLSINEICPEYLADALMCLKMHSEITLTRPTQGDSNTEIVNPAVNIEWQSNVMALVTVQFQQVTETYVHGACADNVILYTPPTGNCNILVINGGATLSGNRVTVGYAFSGGTPTGVRWRSPSINGGSYNNISAVTSFQQIFPVGTHVVFISALCSNGVYGPESSVTFTLQ
jgi:hypothetical protein